MSHLDDYNEKTQKYKERIQMSHTPRPYYTSSYNSETQKWDLITAEELQKRQLNTFKQIEEYFLSDECNWIDMPSYHPDIKFVNCLRRYCKILKDNKVACNDRAALRLIAENSVVIDWRTEYEIWRLIRTSWTEGELLNEYANKIFGMMADRLLQDVFINPALETEINDFSELDPPKNDSNRPYRPWIGSSSSYLSSVGKRKCRVCGKPAIDDICFEHIK